MSATNPLFYLVLGTSGSGRRALIADMVANGNLASAKPAAIFYEDEHKSPDDALLTATGFKLETWQWEDGAISASWEKDTSHIFFFADGAGNPADLIEALLDFLPQFSLSPAKVFSVIDCQLASENPDAALWFEACVHYSDAVLLNHRSGAASKWAEEYIKRFEKLFYPCYFERISHNTVENPSLLLAPEARRMSGVFDEKIELEDETEEEAAAADPLNDRFLARVSGARVEPLPEISSYKK